MTKLELINQAYSLIDQMSVSGPSQDLAYLAKNTLKTLYRIEKGEKDIKVQSDLDRVMAEPISD